MSRAFVKELDDETVALPDRPISTHRNFVTAQGLAAIEASLNRFAAAHKAAIDKNDKQAAAAALREVRYWSARRANAEVVKPSPEPERVAFAATVTLRREDGREQTFMIVGEDEADPRAEPSHIYLRLRGQQWAAQGELIELSGHTAVILNIR